MMLMCGQSNQLWHYLAGKHPGRVGMLLGPSYIKKQVIRNWMPYALDNDAYSAFTKQEPWNESAWLYMLQHVKMKGIKPLWILVPDVVANKEETLEKWNTYAPVARRYGWPLAFAAQDGMIPQDVPSSADVVFIGGTTEWKYRSLPMWCASFPRVHVGRVNELRRLWTCEDFGVESVDGSGWFRDTQDGRRGSHIMQWIDGIRPETMPLNFDAGPVRVAGALADEPPARNSGEMVETQNRKQVIR